MEGRKNSNRYKIISKFECNGKEMIIVRIGSTAHVMSCDEWRKIYGRNHQNRWETKVDWGSFDRETKTYKMEEVS